MIEENVVNGIELAASSTVLEDARTAMSRLVTWMAPLHFIYDAEFRNLGEAELEVAEDLSGRVDSALCDSS